jgi:FtsH-binding integral membrane protein
VIDVSKFTAGSLLAMLVYGLSVPGFGLLLVGLVALLFLGRAIGENDVMLTMYVVGAMTTSYLFPFAVAVYKKHIIWLILVPLITSVVFAIPSSFVALGGCEAGKERAMWAVKAIPVPWGVAAVFDDKKLTCASF